jgi:hypothetical protein
MAAVSAVSTVVASFAGNGSGRIQPIVATLEALLGGYRDRHPRPGDGPCGGDRGKRLVDQQLLRH